VNPTSQPPARQEHNSSANHRKLARQILRALRHHQLDVRGDTRLRVALTLLEHSHLLAREAAVLSKQKLIAELDGKFDEAQVARALKWLTDFKIIVRRIEGYVFCPPPWEAPLRTPEGSRRTRQMEMDLWIDKVESQIELAFEADLNEALRKRFIESSGLVGATSSLVPATSGPALKLVGATSFLVPATSRDAPHTNVGVRVRSLLRQTSDAQEVQRILKAALDYMAEDRRVNMSKERDNPIWQVLASLPDWPSPLAAAVKDCQDTTRATTKNNAARLMDMVKPMLGAARWGEIFPNTQAEWTR
jgi:hypothetical protein